MTERAIVFADLVGYARLTRRDETGTLSYMERRFEEARASARTLSGEIVKTTGDGFVALFPSVAGAIEFAIAFQSAGDGERERRRFRIGIHFGPVRRDTDDVYGHAVNVAARLEGLARPAGILMSQAAFERAGDAARRFAGLGPAVMKNIAERIPVYEYAPGSSGPAAATALVEVVGGIAVSTVDGLQASPRSKRGLSLLSVLALSGGEGRLRTECAALLASEGGDGARAFEQTRRSLSRAFERLGCIGAIQLDGAIVRLDPAQVRVDIDEMLKAARAGAIDDRLIRGIDWDRALCPGVEGMNSTGRSWFRVMRERWRREAATSLEIALDRFAAEEEGARRAASALTAIEPGHEPASRMLMRHYESIGNRPAALAEYERLRNWLDDRFSISPGPQTEELVARVRHAGAGVTRSEHPPLPIRRPDLRIGEFLATPESAELAIGLRSEVIAALSRFREWSVGEQTDHVPAGDYRLEGRLDDGSAQFTLFAAGDGAVLWRERLAAPGADWGTTRRDLVARVAARMEVYISADRISRAFGGSEPAAGFDEWVRAEGLLGRWTSDSENEATEILHGVIARYPGFAPAYASLASIHNVRHIVRPGQPRDADEGARALALALRAIELDPMDARSQLALAWAAALAGRFDQAVVHLDLAAVLNPTSPRTCVSAAMGFAFFGEPARAVALLDQTIGTAPLLAPWQWCYAAPVHYFAGDLRQAAEAAGRGGDAIADNHGWRAAILAEAGDHAAAGAAFTEFEDAVAAIWRGAEPTSPASLIRWFTHAYPLRRSADRARLAAALGHAAARQVSGSA